MTSDKEQVILSALLIYEEWCADRAFEEEYETVQKISNLHKSKYLLFKKMEQCPEKDLPLWNEYVVACEYALQRAWGFTEDSAYHKHWLTPRCTCPRVDNEEGWSYRAIYSRDCPVHKEEATQFKRSMG